MSPLQAAVVSGAVSALAWRAGALRPSGAAAATLVGTVVLTAAGWAGGAVLMAFFLPASVISRWWPAPASALDPKDDRRDAWQVLANGGIPALVVAFGGPPAVMAFAAGLAAAAADTWATALGAHSPTPPRHILKGHVVSPGTSGGVTVFGTVGAAAGAALVAASAVPLIGLGGAAVAFGIGVAGMLLDSALGAGVQGRFHCDYCDRPSEWTMHRCGHATRLEGGCPLVTNDGVNALASLVATAVGWAAY